MSCWFFDKLRTNSGEHLAVLTASEKQIFPPQDDIRIRIETANIVYRRNPGTRLQAPA
jgi:hypothetical protein